MLAGLKKDSFLLWAVVPAIFTVLVIWYPFGFSLGGMLEEWDVLYLMQIHPSFWSSFPGQLLSDTFAARPLQILPHFIANQISANSFLGFHIVLIVACILRIVGAAWIGNFLFRNKAYAATFGMLCFVFPADTQQFEFRTIHITFAIGLMMFASACTISAFVGSKSSRRWISLIVAAVFSCVAVLIYEPAITLYIVAPLVLLARDGFRNFIDLLRVRRSIAIAWLLGPIANAAYLYYAIEIFKSAYQVNAASGGMTKAICHNLHYLIASNAYRIFYDAWVSAWWILKQTVHFGFISFVAVVLFGGILALRNRFRTNIPISQTIRYFIAGIILSVAGYLPFMVAESHMLINQRTFMAVAPGASLVVIATIAWLFQRWSAAGVVAASGFVFLGLIAQLYQFDQYTRDYTGIVLPYTSMLADRTDPTKRIHLVFDRTGFGGHLNGMYESKVQYAASIRRREDDGISILCMDEPQTSLLPFASCTLKTAKWIVRGIDGAITAYPEASVQVITIGPDFDPSYRSQSATWRDHGSFVEAESMFKIADPHTYHCEADSMWGYSGFCRGQGWSDGIFSHENFFQHVNFFVATSQNASLIFPLSPLRKRYILRAAIFGGLTSDLLSHVKVAVNRVDVPVKIIDGQILEAEVPASLLEEGLNRIDFFNVAPPGGATGIGFSRVDLAPLGSLNLPQSNAEKSVPTIVLDQWHEFDKNDIRPLLKDGFSSIESKGTWTDGKSAEITFMLPAGTTAGTFIADAIPFFNESHTRLDVVIDVNGKHVLDKSFSAPAKVESFDVPFQIENDDVQDPVVITFNFKETAKPGPGDQRDLGLYFSRFKVTR